MAKVATKKPLTKQSTQAQKKFSKFVANKKKTNVVKPERKKVIKYQLLHVPSGQHLKLADSGYGFTEAKKAIFGYTKQWKLIKTLIFCCRVCRSVPLFDNSYNHIDLCVPGTNISIGKFNLQSLINRLDYVDINEGIFPDDDYSQDFKKSYNVFLKNPYFYFYTRIVTPEVEEYLDGEDSLITYKIQCNDTTSWDTIMLELFKYMQEAGFSMNLRQFSKDKRTLERILLTEFEIVTVEI
ncbi:MAG: hypothetical protein JHC33_01960 [Ignisphaera sp.]|nr:hypothetical protein [Ignisphaera sp.]